MAATQLLHLLQFASPQLPIGAYSYSQGLEAALQQGLVHDAPSAHAWIARQLHEVVARWDAPLCWRLMQAYTQRDAPAVAELSERAIASRDTAEFRAETVQMGYSLARLIEELGIADEGALAMLRQDDTAGEVPLVSAYACAVAALGIPHEEALLALLFAWAENQVLVCVKSVPLGQVAGQKLLLALRPDIEAAALCAQSLAEHELSNWTPGLSQLSMRHEVQYSRVYRS
ncbi:urease accessory protein UreF [Pseudoduganella flava]|uniref:Urease accessory protein UreF n=1 Tax=Pseudoduganella flava TaxID=871742 RepID=A0ABX6G2T6_9BURK|nr:urease accessory UreF family protein [Pseudoduganella flava]QGZ43366.1 urease accessory protein UreF [Pseudoduganella flava]